MHPLSLDDYNQLVINAAGNYQSLHKHKTQVYKHLKTGKYYFKIGKPVIECTNGFEENTHKVLYSDGIRMYCREEAEFNQKFELVNV